MSVYLGRDYELPRVGAVSGRLLAAIGGGMLLLVIVVLSVSGGDEVEPDAAQLQGAATGETRPTADRSPTLVEDENGVDLDKAEPRAPGEPEPVSLDELKSLSPGEKPPEVAKANAARAGAARATKDKDFDVYAAKSALTAAATKAARCKQGPKGEGSVRVKIARSGKVSSVSLMTPAFQGTAAGTCVEQVFAQATVPAFSGDEKTVFKKFSIR